MELSLNQLKAIFQHLESYSYTDKPELARLCEPFLDQNNRPSVQLRRVERIASALSLRANPIIWFWVHALVPWDFYCAIRLNQAKARIKSLLPVWLDTLFEIEALNSMANFAYLNPDYVFPSESSSDRDGLVFSARALGHPLIPANEKVCNDFALNDEQAIAIITGSNMAGKSTFLRTLGINLCLAYAGAPVNAGSLDTSLFRVFTCIKVSDSVTDGISYFYAEVKRLKALLLASDSGDSLPLFFLIDEIFRGTNNIERHIGSRSYVRSLSKRRVVGAIATHDLELVKLADEMLRIVNYHFREEVRDGRMIFDYKLRSGPCPTTNALKIMEMEGLPVEIEDNRLV
jgi:DNA mismatch repair ATPase MutS